MFLRKAQEDFCLFISKNSFAIVSTRRRWVLQRMSLANKCANKSGLRLNKANETQVILLIKVMIRAWRGVTPLRCPWEEHEYAFNSNIAQLQV